MPVIQLRPTNYYFRNALSVVTSANNTTTALLSAAKLILGQNLTTPSLTTSYADLVEANFTGYSRSPNLTWGAFLNDADTTPTAQSQLVDFRCNVANISNTINSIAVTDGVASPDTGILASGVFASPYQITNPGDGFGCVVCWNLGNVPGELAVNVLT